MRSFLLFIIAGLFFPPAFSQKLPTGTYIFKYCDFEYNSCLGGTCKVVIKGDSISVYATKELAKRRTGTTEGDILAKGIIMKHRSGKWIIGQSLKDKQAELVITDEKVIPELDFKKKQFWTF